MERMFDSMQGVDRSMNEDLPRDVWVKLPGPSYAVIVRLVLLDGNEEYRPARAVRWSATHVMIKLQERDGFDPQYLWVHSRDVQRKFRCTETLRQP